ncbi:MAG: pyruvate kinase [Eubacteriales bacterium]|nr:pyruvate kinase [Eubacteriales bacterium]
MKRTKIICTLGPSSSSKEVIRELILNGMNVARFNFSHGTHESHRELLRTVREVSAELQCPVATLLDTKGPEIRTGLLANPEKQVLLMTGETVILTMEDILGDEKRLSVTYPKLADDVKTGDKLLVDDGLIELRVDAVIEKEIHCTVINGGLLGERKGVNVPGVALEFPTLTEKDKEDILFGIREDFDFIAASFVRNQESILAIKRLLEEHCANIPVISKIECLEAIENMEGIMHYSDGLMIARGDLGVEIPAAQVPFIQKKLIKECNKRYKPVIVATQMLDSMIRNPRPTRAEVNDVANAIYEGADCVMLSGETAGGKYPLAALQTMVNICKTTESHIDFERYTESQKMHRKYNYSSSVSAATVSTAESIGARLIITPTMSGTTARFVSRFRPNCIHVGVSPNIKTVRKMQIYWGVIPFWQEYRENPNIIVQDAINICRKAGYMKRGDLVVITSGMPSMFDGTRKDTNFTNTIRVYVAD